MNIRELATALSELDEALGYYGNVSHDCWRNRLFEPKKSIRPSFRRRPESSNNKHSAKRTML